MKLIDLHCDTLWKLMDLSGNGDLMKNDGCVSIEAMKKGRNDGTVFRLLYLCRRL